MIRTDTPLPLQPPVLEVATPVERLISGIDLLDYGAGGLLPHKIYLVRGGSGVGKTLLGLQYLTRGLELQEPGVLITDQKPANVIAQANAIGFAIGESVRRGQLAILNPSARYFSLVETPADVMAIVEELFDYVKRIGARRLVIDPIYTLINTTYSAHFALTITQSLINALEDLPVTTLLIGGEENAPEVNPILHLLEQNAFGVIDLSKDHMMRLSKLRYANNDSLAARYEILKGRGLMNYRGPAEHAGEASSSVLILGANPETIRRVREALGGEYPLHAEADLAAGVERAKREKPALVLITPSRSISAIAAILDLARNAESSIAFLSPAASRHSDKILYLRAGADDFISEPFNPAELQARVEALIRRSGRRLNLRDRALGNISAEELASMIQSTPLPPLPAGSVIRLRDDGIEFAPEFEERLSRNIETVTKFDQPFALYWIKGDRDLNRALAKLCRQEDIICHNKGGEFVAILTGTDQSGINGFEARLRSALGHRFESSRHGFTLREPGH
jgi:KaiC/GvpD/RAD55 family RecA-like ATPase/CheY-like chemotaxis protein